MDIKDELARQRAINEQLEEALLSGAHAKKAVLTQQFADGLYVDVSGDAFKRYPIVISFTTSGITTRNSVAASTIVILEYALGDGAELQFIPNEANNFISGLFRSGSGSANNLDTIIAYDCTLEGWDLYSRVFRGTIWYGTTQDIMNSDSMRLQGHPLVFNGDSEVRLSAGDKLKFTVNTPSGGTTISIANSALIIHCYALSKVKHATA